MKKSKYNFYYKENGNNYLYNALSNSFAKLTDEDYNFYKQLTKINIKKNDITKEKQSLFQKLKKGNYITNDNFNELNYIKSMYNSAQFNNNILSLTIAPTLDCNFRCPYCFENQNNVDTLNEKHIKKIIDYIAEVSDRINKLHITWYGGEPLLAMNELNKLSEKMIQICKDKNIGYKANIITNGYLLNEEIAQQLKDNKIKSVQVTLDGPQPVNDMTRILENGEGSYNKIVSNIENHYDKFKINVRVNVSKENKNYLRELLMDLKERDLHQKIGIYIAHVDTPTEESEDYANSCLARPNFSELKIKFFNMAYDMGFNKVWLYPRVMLAGCSASGNNSYVIAGDGYIYKCWNSVGKKEEAVGTVDNFNKFNPNIYDWLSFSPLEDDECLECKVLPLCMGNCPYYFVIKDKKPICSIFKYNLDDVLRAYRKQQEIIKS